MLNDRIKYYQGSLKTGPYRSYEDSKKISSLASAIHTNATKSVPPPALSSGPAHNVYNYVAPATQYPTPAFPTASATRTGAKSTVITFEPPKQSWRKAQDDDYKIAK